MAILLQDRGFLKMGNEFDNWDGEYGGMGHGNLMNGEDRQ